MSVITSDLLHIKPERIKKDLHVCINKYTGIKTHTMPDYGYESVVAAKERKHGNRWQGQCETIKLSCAFNPKIRMAHRKFQYYKRYRIIRCFLDWNGSSRVEGKHKHRIKRGSELKLGGEREREVERNATRDQTLT